MTAFVQQVFNGLVNGSFYAMLALGLSVIFGMLGVVNFAHGALYMLGAFGAVILANSGMGFGTALVVVPVVLGVVGMLVERTVIRRLTPLDPLYNFLLTFGLALVVQDLIRSHYGVQSQPYERSPFSGTVHLGLFDYPTYQVFVLCFSVVTCVLVWLLISRTRVGRIVRASTERPDLTRALGIDVSRWLTPVFGFGVGLAGLAGVLAAPMRAVSSDMGADLVIVLFAVVVIGGLGSVFGSVVAGFAVGMVQALGNLYVPVLSQISVFLLMALVLLLRPAGLFGKETQT